MFSRSDPIAVLNFSAKVKDASNINYVPEQPSMFCFQLYLTGKAEVLVRARMIGCQMAMDKRQHELLHTYKEVVQLILRTYANDELVAMAYSEVVNFKQSSLIA